VVNTLLGKGAVDETHPCTWACWHARHGVREQGRVDCDLIMAIGARWDDRITGRVSDSARTR